MCCNAVVMKDFKHMHTLVLRNRLFSCRNGYVMVYFYDVTILDVSCNKSNDVKGRVVQWLKFRLVDVAL